MADNSLFSNLKAWASAQATTLSNNVVSLFPVNIYKQAGDPGMERQILKRGASYGRQLSAVLNALDYIVREVPELDPKAEPLATLSRVREDVGAAKRAYQEGGKSTVNRVLSDLRKLSHDDPAGFAWVLQEVGAFDSAQLPEAAQ